MTLYVNDADFQLHVGDALTVLRQIPDETVDCVVTSPPYWGLRDYSVEGQLGLEPTPDQYVTRIVEVFREVRRVLAKHGTCWVNLGSSYASGGTRPSPSPQPERAPAYGNDGTTLPDSQGTGSSYRDLCDECLADFLSHRDHTEHNSQPRELTPLPLERKGRGNAPKDSEPATSDGEPHVVQESTTLESWRRLRGECSRCSNRASSLSGLGSDAGGALGFAHKDGDNLDMSWTSPSSADRTTDTESSALAYLYSSIAARQLKPKNDVLIPQILALALQMDGWIVRSEIIWAKRNCMPESVTDRPTKSHETIWLLAKSPRYWFDQEAVRESHSSDALERTLNPRHGFGSGEGDSSKRTMHAVGAHPNGRNVRSVWEIATQPYPEAHFATFPEELARRCILAGCPTRVCRVCGKPSERLTAVDVDAPPSPSEVHHGGGMMQGGFGNPARKTLGWSDCGHNDYRPGVVLDPFLGSGTTALVARNHGRHAIGIELSAEYAELAAKRTRQLSLLSEGNAA